MALSQPMLLNLATSTLHRNYESLLHLLEALQAGKIPIPQPAAEAHSPDSAISAEPLVTSVDIGSDTEVGDKHLEDAGVAAAAPSSLVVPPQPPAVGGGSKTGCEALLQRMLAQGPALLYLSPNTLCAHASGLCEQLQISPQQLFAALRMYPSLLLLDPSSCANKVVAIGGALGLTPQLALKLVMKAPNVLSLSADNLAARFQALVQLFGVSPSRASTLVQWHPTLLARCVPRAIQRPLSSSPVCCSSTIAV